MGVHFRFGFDVWILGVRDWVGMGGDGPCVLALLYFLILSLSTISRASTDRSGDGRGCGPVLRLFSVASALSSASAVSIPMAPDEVGILSSSIFACSCERKGVVSWVRVSWCSMRVCLVCGLGRCGLCGGVCERFCLCGLRRLLRGDV